MINLHVNAVLAISSKEMISISSFLNKRNSELSLESMMALRWEYNNGTELVRAENY